MTREESTIITKRRIRTAKSGSEITRALLEHFKLFEKTTVPIEDTVAEYNSPLFGLD